MKKLLFITTLSMVLLACEKSKDKPEVFVLAHLYPSPQLHNPFSLSDIKSAQDAPITNAAGKSITVSEGKYTFEIPCYNNDNLAYAKASINVEDGKKYMLQFRNCGLLFNQLSHSFSQELKIINAYITLDTDTEFEHVDIGSTLLSEGKNTISQICHSKSNSLSQYYKLKFSDRVQKLSFNDCAWSMKTLPIKKRG